MQDAFDAGYQTIWVMEDDIFVNDSPLILSELIEKLDQLVGEEGWDILYTDLDTKDKPTYNIENDFESDLKGILWFLWRPDVPTDETLFRKRKILSKDFLEIGSRMRTHSMIIRRSGIVKILEHEKKQGTFNPYDHELAFIPEIRLFSLRYPLVTFIDTITDIKECHE